mgnify:CR=1 FL=1|jgi:glycosyltransferase involved in cell wall biosynthesis
MKPIVKNPDNIHHADLIVGIPSYQEADSIAYPTQVAAEGLREYFPGVRSVIINVDNHSPDGTEDVFMNTDTGDIPKIYISTPDGVKGKGNNFYNLFRATAELGARGVAVVDADLKSITPKWIQALAEPVMGRYDYVCPLYVRHKYDGTITNHIAYPMIRTLGGIRVRQPIGGDFGFSGRVAAAYLAEKLWNDKTAHFGIDIWMTSIAVARRFNVCQAFLGTPKIHRPKDPAADLSAMFNQVVSTIFDLMIDFEYLWKAARESRPSAIYGFGLGMDQQAPAVHVSTDKLFASFHAGAEKYGDLWREVLSDQSWNDLEELLAIGGENDFIYHSDVWARIFFDYAVAYKVMEPSEREGLMESLIPFYHSRVLSFVNKTIDHDARQAEEYLEQIQRVFEQEKPYLIKRWDTAGDGNGRMFG